MTIESAGGASPDRPESGVSGNVHIPFRSCRAGVSIPKKATSGSAGFDLKSAEDDTVIIRSGEWALIHTGLLLEIPEGYEGQVRPRSGLALKEGLTVLNAPGTIDSDYRGEIGVILINHGDNNAYIDPGDRIAQLVVAKVERVKFIAANGVLSATERGEGGFGSTGVAA